MSVGVRDVEDAKAEEVGADIGTGAGQAEAPDLLGKRLVALSVRNSWFGRKTLAATTTLSVMRRPSDHDT